MKKVNKETKIKFIVNLFNNQVGKQFNKQKSKLKKNKSNLSVKMINNLKNNQIMKKILYMTKKLIDCTMIKIRLQTYKIIV